METTLLLRDWSRNFKRFQEFWPAVHNNWPSVGRVDSLDLLEEFQHADGWEWHPEVWPAGEVELGDQAGGSGTIAALLWSRDLESPPGHGSFLATNVKANKWFDPTCYSRQNLIKSAFLSGFYCISWTVSLEDVVSFSWSFAVSALRGMNVKSVYSAARQQRRWEHIVTSLPSDADATKWMWQSEEDETHASEKAATLPVNKAPKMAEKTGIFVQYFMPVKFRCMAKITCFLKTQHFY